MLHIDVSDFTLEKFLEDITYPDYTWDTNITDHQYEGGYGIRISVNGKYIVNDPSRENNMAYVLHTTLESMNNAFFKLLKGDEQVDIILDWGSGGRQILKAKKDDDKLLLTTVITRFPFDHNIENQAVDFRQACEEVLRVVKYYKDICSEAAKKICPDNPAIFLKDLFHPPPICRIDWLPLEEAWKEYQSSPHQHDLP